MAIATRLLLIPLSHTWDGLTWANTFAQLAAPGSFLEVLQRPYETVRELTLLTRAAGHHTDFYEGWAYPPLMLYVYWPLAKLYAVLGGHLQALYPVQPTFFASSIPIPLLVLIRLPNIVADVGSILLLRRLGASVRQAAWYAFNPLVLLVGVWTFDSVMVVFLLLALLLAEENRWGWAGAALGLGAATKFVPLVGLPVFLLAILARNATIRERIATAGRLLAGCAVSMAVLVWPVWQGLWDVLQYHAGRFSLGLTAQWAWRLWAAELPQTDWQPRWQLYASALAGNLLLPLALLAGCALVAWRPVDLRTGLTIMVAAFLLGSKLVNEPYALAPVALLTAVLARRDWPALTTCRTLLWVVAFAYALVQMPIWALLFSTAQQIQPALGAGLTAWANAYRVFLDQPEAPDAFAVLGTLFSAVLGWTLWTASREPGESTSRTPRLVLVRA